jgi:predicted ABC-type ATPase
VTADPPLRSQARLRVFAGPNGSGKSTIHTELRPEWIGVYVNADDIEKALAVRGQLELADFELDSTDGAFQRRFATLVNSSGLLTSAGLAGVADRVTWVGGALQVPRADVNSYLASVTADFIRRELLGQGASFTFETVMSSPDKVAFMREAQAQGYRTYLYFVATGDPTINIERVRLRVSEGGHAVPDDKVVQRYHRSIELLDEACGAANRAYIFDNSGAAHELIAEVTNGESLEVRTAAMPAWFVATSLWRSFQD